MLRMQPTKNLTGVTIQADFDTLYDLVHSIYNLTGTEMEDYNNPYYGVKHRLLGVCYDLRHTFMGDRKVFLEKNNLCDEQQEWHGVKTPEKNLYYSVNILFPEMIFLALAVPKMYLFSYEYYGHKYHKDEETFMGLKKPIIPYAQYVRDRANLDVLCAAVWEALSEVIGEEEMEKLLFGMQRSDEAYLHYATHYVDRCNVELLKTDVEKRKDKLRNITKRLMKKPEAYKSMERDLRYWAREYHTSIYELEDPRVEYPEDVEW